MVKKKKGRSVKRNNNVNVEPEELTQAPHSFVIHKGLPGDHIVELTKDFRKLMEPFTATALKVYIILALRSSFLENAVSKKLIFRSGKEIQLKILSLLLDYFM